MAIVDPGAWTGEHAPLVDAPSPDVLAEPESFVVPVDTGERIHYLDWGGPSDETAPDLPMLLLLHGLFQTGWIWAPVARRLRARTRVIAVDLRGHGLSETPRRGYDLASCAWDVLTVAAANGFGADVGGRRVVVAGHGSGAMVAATMAGLRPESVAGLGLVDGGWEELAEATRQSPPEFLAALAEPPEVMASMEAFLADRQAFDPETWDADQERAARAQVDQKHAGHVALVSRAIAVRGLVDAMFGYEPGPALRAVAAPLLVLVAESGSADDEVLRERRLALADVQRDRAAAGLSPARVVRFPGVGHNLMRYRPPEVSAELLGLLRMASA